MNKSTKTLTISALLLALTIVTLYVSSFWPTGQLSLAALASMFTAVVIIEAGIRAGICVFAACAVLSLLILPSRWVLLLYMAFFGYYPIVKSFIERKEKAALRWFWKIFVFNVAVIVVVFVMGIFTFGEFIPSFRGVQLSTIVLHAVGSVVFVLFDYGFTKAIWLYINRVSKYINKGK